MVLRVGTTDTVKDGVIVEAILGRNDDETTDGAEDGPMEGRLVVLMDG